MPQLDDIFNVGNGIDSFAPGHYARVFEAQDKRDNRTVALKVMRYEHLSRDDQPKREALAFGNEADLLSRMAIMPTVMRLIDCGYIKNADGNISDDPHGAQIESFGLSIDSFRRGVFRLSPNEWRPYLALEFLPRTTNLLYVMRTPSPNNRWRLPTEEGLDIAFQFADVLRAAHRQQIVYLDYKLEHLHWDGTTLKIIDWNSSRLVENGAQVLASQIQTDLHNLCVGVLYPIFTGQSPMKGSLKPMPADQATVDSRYSEINQLDFSVEPGLSISIQELLNRGARKLYANIDQFTDALGQSAVNFGWRPGATQQARGEARQFMREALAKLRSGQEQIRAARELIREAQIMDDLGDDFESELKRVLGSVNDMLNRRVIP